MPGRPATSGSRQRSSRAGHARTIRFVKSRTAIRCRRTVARTVRRGDHHVRPGSGTRDRIVTRRGNGIRGRPGTRAPRVIRGHGATIDGRRPRGIVTPGTRVTDSSSAIPGNLATLDHRGSPGSGTLDLKAIARTHAGGTPATAAPRNAAENRTRTDRSRHGPTGTPGHRATSRRATSRRDRPNTQIETASRSTSARTAAGASNRGSRSPEAARTVAKVTGATRGNRNHRDTTADLVPVRGGRLRRAASNAIAHAVAGRRNHLRHRDRVVRTANQVPASSRHRALPRDRASRSPLRPGLPSVAG